MKWKTEAIYNANIINTIPKDNKQTREVLKILQRLLFYSNKILNQSTISEFLEKFYDSQSKIAEDKLEKIESFKAKLKKYNYEELRNLNDKSFISLVNNKEIGKVLDKYLNREFTFKKYEECQKLCPKYYSLSDLAKEKYNECFKNSLFQLAKQNKPSKYILILSFLLNRL